MSRRPRRSQVSAGETRGAERPPAIAWRRHFASLPGSVPVALLALLACLAYANGWPNALVYDDRYFVVAERFADPHWSGVLRFFSEDIWAGYGADSGLYRPLFACVIAVEWLLFGEWASGYHLFNIALHALVTVLVFVWLRRMLATDRASPPLQSSTAFLAAAIFAVHPVHAEVVNSVFNGSELWATFGVVGGLLWLLAQVDVRPLRAWVGLGLVYFAALLLRETAAVLPALAALTAWMTGTGDWRSRLRRTAPVLWLALPLALYLALRVTALGGLGSAGPGPEFEHDGPIEQALDEDPGMVIGAHRLLPAVQTWYFALRLFLWPAPLSIQHLIADVPAWLAVSTQVLLVAAAVFLAVRRRPLLAFGLAFFYLTMLPITVFMGRDLALVNLQERYVYLPSAGLVLVVALILAALWRRFGAQAPALSALVIVLIFTPLCWQRNADWSSNRSLFEAEYEAGRRGNMLLANLVRGYAIEGDFVSAARICDAEADILDSPSRFARSCGQVYSGLGRYVDAERALLPSTERGRDQQLAHDTLANLYVKLGRREEARAHYEWAIEKEPVPAMEELRRAYLLNGLYPDDPGRRREALQHVERALELQPRLVQAQELRKKLLAE